MAVGITGARARPAAATARSKHATSQDGDRDRPLGSGTYELFTVEEITAGAGKRISDRYYQVQAVQDICAQLADGGRGQLLAACGTGKTLISQRAAQMMCPDDGIAVIVCPSIALVAQTLREWEETADDYIALAVCSDDTVRDAIITVDDVPATVTTSPETVAQWLATDSTTPRLRLIVGTHQSAHVIGLGLIEAGTRANILVVDEAHRTAGLVDKHTAVVHDDTKIPADRRLYATATPKVLNERTRGAAKGELTRVVGMDDHTVFGSVLYNYPFAQAIDDGYLDDYRLVVMGVTRKEVLQALAKLPRTAIGGDLNTSLHTAMVQTVVAKAALKYEFRRALVFCQRLNEAADFARSMATTLKALPPRSKPRLPLSTGFVHGGMTTTERNQRLRLLIQPPNDGWSVVTNVRCLSEGVDVPAIDAVAFTHPKQSVTEIVQAIGRALRKAPDGNGMATIIVPVLLPDNAADLDDLEALADTRVADYRLLWQVLKALRAHDGRIGAAIDRAETAPRATSEWTQEDQPLTHLLVDLPPGYDDGSFLRQLTAKIITSSRSSWWNNYAALAAYHREHGHTNLRRDVIVSDESTGEDIRLGAWTDTVRVNYRKGLLSPDRIEALNELDFDFLSRAVQWTEGLAAAKSFHANHGHLEPVRSLRVLGVDLLSWLDKQRRLAEEGRLADNRRDALTGIGMRWIQRPKTFDQWLAALAAYHERHGHIDIPPDPASKDGYLGSWLVTVRIRRKMGHVSDAEAAALDALGMRWRPLPPKSTSASPEPHAATGSSKRTPRSHSTSSGRPKTKAARRAS
jgi:superfamily II DNA or RNA helicase